MIPKINKNGALEILIVDDDQNTCFMHRRLLDQRTLFNPVKILGNGREAWEYVAELGATGTSFLIFLDLALPLMNGWEFMEHLQLYGADLNVFVVVVAAFPAESDRKRALAFPQVIGYEPKPLKPDRVNKILNHKRVKQFLL